MFFGTVVKDSGHGFYWVEQDETHSRVFLHQRNVIDERYLHPGDRIEFGLEPNPIRPEKLWAINARYLSSVTAHETERAVRP